MRQQTGRAVVGEREAIGPVVAVAVDAWVGQARDRPLRAEQLASMVGDRVEDLAQLGAAGELEGDRMEGRTLVLLAAEIGEGRGQGRGGAYRAGEVREGRHRDRRISGRMEDKAHRPDRGDAAGQRQVDDGCIDIGALGLSGTGRHGGRLVQDGMGPQHAGAVAEVARPSRGQWLAARPADADLAGERAGVLEHVVERCRKHRRKLVVALERRGHGMGGGEVPVRLDELALSAIKDREDAEGEDHGAAAHHQGREDVDGVVRNAGVDHEIAGQLEGPDQADR